MTRLHPAALAALCFLPAVSLPAAVRINEFQSAPNEILPEFDAPGVPRVGYGPAWWESGFYDGAWLTGTTPIGHSTTGLGKDLGAAMDDKTPSLYVRKTFTLTALDVNEPVDLLLRVWYDDGFVAYLNGREVTRANLGPAKQITYRDQVTYRAATIDPQPAEYNLGTLNTRLVTGVNVLALQVHNRDLGGACRIDASLYSTGPATYETLAEFSFDDANSASRTHQRNGATVTNTGSDTPPAGSWLALAPDPASDAAWPDLTITTTLPPAGGVNGSGGLEYSITQGSAGNFAAAVCAPPVNVAAHLTAGTWSASDLARLDLSFRYMTSANASFGFRIDPAPGASAQALTGFPNVSAAGSTAEDALKEFADNSNGSRTRTVNSSGSGSNTSSGLVRHSPVLDHGPAMKNAAFRYHESNVAGEGYNGSTGAIRFELTDTPDSPAAPCGAGRRGRSPLRISRESISLSPSSCPLA